MLTFVPCEAVNLLDDVTLLFSFCIHSIKSIWDMHPFTKILYIYYHQHAVATVTSWCLMYIHAYSILGCHFLTKLFGLQFPSCWLTCTASAIQTSNYPLFIHENISLLNHDRLQISLFIFVPWYCYEMLIPSVCHGNYRENYLFWYFN